VGHAHRDAVGARQQQRVDVQPLVASAGYTFNPSTGNTATISLPSGTSARYVQLSFTGNTGWSAAQLSEFEVFPGGGSSGTSSR